MMGHAQEVEEEFHRDPVLLAHEVVEAAVGGSLNPKKPRKTKPATHKPKKSK